MGESLTPSTLHSSLASICPQEYPSLPKSPSELTPYLSTTIEAAYQAVSSIPAHPSAPCAVPENHEIQKLFKPVKPPSTPVPPGDMKLWKLSAKDGKGAWFARRSVHDNIGFDRFKRGLEVEFALGEKGLKGIERQEVPGGGVESVRGIGCVERVGETVAEHGEVGGEMNVFRLAAQFPGPTAAREFVTVCCKKQGRDESQGRWFMIVSRPVKAGCEVENVCPGRETEGYIRGKYESVEYIREVIPEGEGDEQVGESEVEEYTADEGEHNNVGEVVDEDLRSREDGQDKRRRHRKRKHRRHRMHPQEDDAANLVPFEKLPNPESTPSSNPATPGSEPSHPKQPPQVRNYAIEWVMLSRSDPGGNVPRWMVERGTPGGIVKDAEKFLKWLAALSDEELGFKSPRGVVGTDSDELGISVTPKGEVVKEEEGGKFSPITGEDTPEDSHRENEGLVNSVLGMASQMVSSLAPTNLLPNVPSILGRSGSPTSGSNVTPKQGLSPSSRCSIDAASIQSFSTASQDPVTLNSPPPTPPSVSTDAPLTPSTTSSTISGAPALPHTNNAESKPLSRLLSRKSRLVARLEKAIQKNRKGEDAEKRLREKYEEELRREEEKYKRDMEKLWRRKEREAQKQLEKSQKEKEKEEKEKEKEKEKKGREKQQASIASQLVTEVKEIVERLTRENETLARENKELRRRISKLEAGGEETQ